LVRQKDADVMNTQQPASDPSSRDITKIGLCFSGGGFRASFFALGVLRYLAEADAIDRVVAISSVSGGSIAAAAAADRWSEFKSSGGDGAAYLKTIDQPFRDVVTTKNIRRRWMFGSTLALIPFTGGRGGAYSRALAHNLYRHKRVAALPPYPEFIFNSTDLTKGHTFRVAPAYIGSWDYGYREPTPTSVTLGAAVAASAAFPPSLTVVYLKTKRLSLPRAAPPIISLVDGGVYDNLGLEWFQGWTADAERPVAATKPEFVIVANASGTFEHKDQRFRPAGAVKRELAIQYQQSLNLRIRWNHQALVNAGGGVYMAINSDPRSESLPAGDTTGALPSELLPPLAALRTDLDRFSREEADLLSYHAYWTLHARLATYAPALAIAAPSWTEYADLSPAEVARLRRLLDVGAHRFLRRVRARLRRGDS
jgi:predicted acylesterase/phospholipase RssA